MALLQGFTERDLQRISLHKPIDASYTCFEKDGRKILQIDTYGSAERKMPGKTSQSIQLDHKSARVLFEIMKKHFSF